MKAFAPAKVNLALHVTGRRDDGYHLLDSLVVFAGVGDWVTFEPGPALSLSVTGPRADGVPTDGRNLVWKTAKALGATGHLTLEKHLPHAGGIGGGSADAAATARLVGSDQPDPELLLALGADIPVCIESRPVRMRGIGERLDPVPPLPPLWIVLVNPGVDVPTGPVFKALVQTENGAMPDPYWHDFESFLAWLGQTRNDLQAPACALVPGVAEVIEALADHAAPVFSGMSGSGGTCFALCDTEAAAETLAADLRARSPRWWVVAAPILDGAGADLS